MTALLIGDPAYFERLAEVERDHWWSLGMWRLASGWLRAALHGRSGLLALDVGCGAGGMAVRLTNLEPIGRVVGLDPSPVALNHARRRHAFPLVVGSATDLPFGDASVDVLTCLDVLQHLEPGGDARALSEIRRVLKRDGVALVRSNGRGLSAERRAYRLADLTELSDRAGLVVLRSSYANCLPALAQEVRGRLPRRRGTGVRPHPEGGGLQIRVPPPWINAAMSTVAAAEAVAAGRLNLRLPFGHSTMLLVGRSSV